MNFEDTIVAQVTPPGRSGVGILRISGLKTQEIAVLILGQVPKPRYAYYHSFKDINSRILDSGIAIWFPSPHSFTGEDVLELHSHGSPIVLDILLKTILMLPNVRIAKPGEFSERAFLNDKLDLSQAEAIADLINASSEQAARAALNSLQGAFSVHIECLTKKLTDLRIYIEATIEFPEEENTVFLNNKIEDQLNQIIDNLNAIIKEAYNGSILREGKKVVITGRPNSGKSSLFNIITGREVAIVTDIAGTTRDVLREHIHIDGIPLYIIDTAGLCDTKDKIELIGIARAWQEIKQADLLLFVIDATVTNAIDPMDVWPDFIAHLPNNLPITVIRNKIDLTGETASFSTVKNYSVVCMSTYTGAGMNMLLNHLKGNLIINAEGGGQFLARRRHLEALEKARKHLFQCKSKLINAFTYESIAEELCLAQTSLNEITGKITSSNLLDKIFSTFCIGK